MAGDIIGLREEAVPRSKPLLKKVMDQGRLLRHHPPLKTCREYFLKEITRLPADYKNLHQPLDYPVRISPKLAELQSRVENQIRRTELAKA